jgi:AcrR family transcriptional regulator
MKVIMLPFQMFLSIKNLLWGCMVNVDMSKMRSVVVTTSKIQETHTNSLITLYKVHVQTILNGYEHTTAKEIAAHAGVATGTFYRYFSDKRQLLMSLLENQIEMLMPPEPKWGVSNPESTLASLLEAHDKRIKEMGMQRVLPELLAKDTEFAEVLAASKRKIFTRILSGLTKAYEKGLTWKDLDLNTVTWSLMTLAEHTPEKMKQCGNVTDYREVAKVICRLIFPPEVIKNLQSDEAETEEE